MGTTAFDAAHVRKYVLNLNRKTDADLIAHLEAQPSRLDHLRRLIRADMAAKGIPVNDAPARPASDLPAE